MTDKIDYRATFMSQFGALKHENALFAEMERTVENSPWHREANVLVHTEMVVDEYVNAADLYHSDECRIDPVWDRMTYLGAIAAAFHDVGKPAARTAKFSEARGNYFSYPGHELMSARLFEDYATKRFPMFGAQDIYIICWMLEHHMPWEVKDKTKRENMAKTVKMYDLLDVFTRLLLSDQYGRTSDDAETKRADVRAWIAEFRELAETVKLSPVDIDAPVLYMPIACSGSGKSTFRASLGDVNTFSLDDLRHEFYDATDYARAFQLSTEDKSFDARANARFHAVVKQKQDLYLDNTNCSAKRRRWYLDIARKHGYTVTAVLFPINIDEVIRRQTTRTDKTVPAHAVQRQYMSLQLPSIGEFDTILIRSDNM
jgi:predicted kinase